MNHKKITAAITTQVISTWDSSATAPFFHSGLMCIRTRGGDKTVGETISGVFHDFHIAPSQIPHDAGRQSRQRYGSVGEVPKGHDRLCVASKMTTKIAAAPPIKSRSELAVNPTAEICELL
jgi:hypothetical protein